MIYGCDFAPTAISCCRHHPAYDPAKCRVFQHDITKATVQSFLLDGGIEESSLDVIVMVFVLSAIHPDQMTSAIKTLYKVSSYITILSNILR
jgi:hypothetical protein